MGIELFPFGRPERGVGAAGVVVPAFQPADTGAKLFVLEQDVGLVGECGHRSGVAGLCSQALFGQGCGLSLGFAQGGFYFGHAAIAKDGDLLPVWKHSEGVRDKAAFFDSPADGTGRKAGDVGKCADG